MYNIFLGGQLTSDFIQQALIKNLLCTRHRIPALRVIMAHLGGTGTQTDTYTLMVSTGHDRDVCNIFWNERRESS